MRKQHRLVRDSSSVLAQQVLRLVGGSGLEMTLKPCFDSSAECWLS